MLGLVADLGLLAALGVLGRMLLGFLDHTLDLFLGKGRAAGDRHRLLLARRLVASRDVDDAVGVDVEGGLDLRNAPGRRRDAGQVEGSEQLVVAGELTLALEHLNRHGRLVVRRGGEGLAALGRDRCVALNELRHDSAGPAQARLDAEGKRGDVNEQHVLAVAGDDARLERGADGHDLVGIDALVGLLAAGQLLDDVRHGRHTGRSADQHDVVDVGDLDSRVAHDVVERLLRAFEEVLRHLLELRPGQRLIDVDGARFRHRNVGQRDVGRRRRGQLLLGLLGGFLQTLKRDLVLGKVGAGRRLDLLDEPVDNPLVPVVAAELVVAGGGAHLDGGESVVVLAHLEEGDVEGSAAEIEDEDQLVLLALFKTVGEGRGGGLVDDALNVEPGDLARVLRGLALGVVEVSRNGDDGVGHGFAEVCLGVLLQLLQDEGRDLLRRVDGAVDVDLPVRAHVALDGRDRAVDVRDGLPLRDLSDEDLAVLRKADDRGGRARSLGVGDDGRFPALEDGDARIRCAEVDA